MGKRQFAHVKDTKLVEELIVIRNEFSQLQASQTTVSKVFEDFIRDNAKFLQDAITARGKLDYIESEIFSVMKRLEKLEENKNLQRARRITTISTITAIISVIIAAVSIILK